MTKAEFVLMAQAIECYTRGDSVLDAYELSDAEMTTAIDLKSRGLGETHKLRYSSRWFFIVTPAGKKALLEFIYERLTA